MLEQIYEMDAKWSWYLRNRGDSGRNAGEILQVLRIPRNAARREAENETGKDSMTGNIPYTAIKYWISLQQSARGNGETVLWLAGWTAEGRVLGKETKGRTWHRRTCLHM